MMLKIFFVLICAFTFNQLGNFGGCIKSILLKFTQ